MYNNIGRKLKSLAVFFFVIGAIASIILALICMASVDFNVKPIFYVGISLLFGGPIFSYILSMGLYGFGELIEKATEIAENTSDNRSFCKSQTSNSTSASVVSHSPAPVTPITANTEKTQQPIPVVTTLPDKIEKSKVDLFMQVSSQIPIIARNAEFIESYRKDIQFLNILSSMSDNSQQLTFLRLTYSYYESDTMTADEYNKKVDNLLGTEDRQRRKQTNQSSAFSNSFDDLIPLLPIHIRGNTAFLN